MGVKPILLLLCLRSCLSYPIDGQGNIVNDAEFTPKFSNDFSDGNTNARILGNFMPESMRNLPIISPEYINRQEMPGMEPNPLPFGLDYPNNAESNRPTYFGGHRPIGRPPRPQPQPPIHIPDDVEVFTPPESPRPVPPAKPVPVGPNLPGDVEEFWPVNGKPVSFPKEGFYVGGGEGGPAEMLPIMIERKQFPAAPVRVESEIQMAAGPMRNERPVMIEENGLPLRPMMIEKQNPIILTREQPHMMPVLLENDPVRFEKIERPMTTETEHPKMTFFGQSTHAVPMGMENEMTFMSPTRQYQISSFNENERMERNPSEFRPIPQVLPERFRRDVKFVRNNPEPVVVLEGKEFDEIEQKSILDNEISNDRPVQNNFIPIEDKYTDMFSIQELAVSNETESNSEIHVNDETSDNISPATTSTVIDVEKDSTSKIAIKNEGETSEVENTSVVISSQTTSNAPSEETTTTMSKLDTEKIFNDDNTSPGEKIVVEEHRKSEQGQNSNISTIVQPSNNSNDEEKIIAATSTIMPDAKIEISNPNVETSDTIIKNEQNKDEIPSEVEPTKIPITKPASSTENIPADIKEELKTYLMKLLEDISKNKKKLQAPSTFEIRPIDLPYAEQPSVLIDATEKAPPVHELTDEIQHTVIFPHPPYLPVHLPKLQHDTNYDFGRLFGNLRQEVFNLQQNVQGSQGFSSFSQMYPSFDNFHYQIPQISSLPTVRISEERLHKYY